MVLRTYSGSCHCGLIAYEADLDLAQGTAKCNCSFCLKARAWKAFVKPEAFRLVRGEDAAVGYRAHPQASRKFFCRQCGVRTHELGSADYLGGDFVGIFVASLDDATSQELVAAPVRYADGRHNNWRNPPAMTGHL